MGQGKLDDCLAKIRHGAAECRLEPFGATIDRVHELCPLIVEGVGGTLGADLVAVDVGHHIDKGLLMLPDHAGEDVLLCLDGIDVASACVDLHLQEGDQDTCCVLCRDATDELLALHLGQILRRLCQDIDCLRETHELALCCREHLLAIAAKGSLE